MPFTTLENAEDFGPDTKLEIFALEYLKDLNAAAAGRRAGYSPGTLHSNATRMLRHPIVQAVLKREVERRRELLQAEADFVVRELLALASVDIAAAFDEKTGSLLPIHQIPPEVRKALAGVEVFEEFAGKGEARQHVGNTTKVKWWDRIRALELLGKYHGLFAEKVDLTVTTNAATRILEARKRGREPITLQQTPESLA